jgi:hypothetical protein
MHDEPSKKVPDWLAALRDPIEGGPYLSHYIVAPEHIPDVLRAFGAPPLHARRVLVSAINEMATKLWLAREGRPPLRFAEAQKKLESLGAAARNLKNKLTDHELRRAIFWANISKLPALDSQERTHGEKRIPTSIFGAIDEGLKFLIEGVDALRNSKVYHRVFDQPSSSDSRMRPERALLWEPLLALMTDFKIASFREHQPLIATIRSLHLACGIEPPDPGAVRQTVKDWRKRQR